MARLELDERETVTLRDALEDYVSDLRMEIANTDSQDVRDELKKREEILKSVIARLAGKAASPP
jgi:hypothetical protein